MARLFDKLVPKMRRRILDYIDSPSYEKWKEIRDIMVLPRESLYDVMDEIDMCWPGKYPSAILVARCSEVVEARLKEPFDILSKGPAEVFDILSKELEDPTFWDDKD